MASSIRLCAISITLLYFIVAMLWNGGGTFEMVPLILGYAQTFVGTWALVGLVLLLWCAFTQERAGVHRGPWRIAAQFAQSHWRADRGLSFIAPLASVVILLSSYTFIKQFLLPHAGFTMGPILAAGERSVFGADPWEISHKVLSSPWATKGLDLAYHAWFLPMILGVALCSFCSSNSVLAARYLLAYVLLWPIQGSLLAYLMPAAGPCFFNIFQADKERFEALMNLLQHQDLWLRQHGVGGLASLQFQAKLLELYHSGEAVPGGGISAMPSLHNAMAALFACAGYAIDRRLGAVLSAYCGIILVASVHLGWHYLSDGLVAIAVTMLVWKATGALARVVAWAAQQKPGRAEAALDPPI